MRDNLLCCEYFVVIKKYEYLFKLKTKRVLQNIQNNGKYRITVHMLLEY